MSKIEYNDNFSKDEILNKLEMMYQKSRDISYTPYLLLKKFKDRISELCLSFQNSSRRIFVVGNEDAIWNTLNADIQEEVFLILQEFLVNTKNTAKPTELL